MGKRFVKPKSLSSNEVHIFKRDNSLEITVIVTAKGISFKMKTQTYDLKLHVSNTICSKLSLLKPSKNKNSMADNGVWEYPEAEMKILTTSLNKRWIFATYRCIATVERGTSSVFLHRKNSDTIGVLEVYFEGVGALCTEATTPAARLDTL